jgi:hypothetical protein
VRRLLHGFAVGAFRQTNRALHPVGLSLTKRMSNAPPEVGEISLDPGSATLLGLSHREPLTMVVVGAGYDHGLGDVDSGIDFICSYPERVAKVVLVEPFESRLRATASLIPAGVHVIEVLAAVAPEAGPFRLWKVDAEGHELLRNIGFGTGHVDSAGGGWTSFSREHVVGLLAGHLGVTQSAAANHVIDVSVDAAPLKDVLINSGITRVDYLQTDVEGMDDEALYTIDLAELRPSFVRCEFTHLSHARRKRLSTWFSSYGYEGPLRLSGLDAGFVLKPRS